MRAFVGAFVSEASAGRLHAAAAACFREPARRLDGRLVPRQNYHVTLKFLGEVQEDALRVALRAVEALAPHRVSAQVTGFAGLPTSSRARLAAALLDRDAELERWWAALQQTLGRESRGFRPHVTVMRFRRTEAFVPVPVPSLALELEPPRLYRSDRTRDGSRYRPVVLA